MSACSGALRELMDMCWTEEPTQRPLFIRIRSIVQTSIKKSGDNIVDHLIKRMETYATELETQVKSKHIKYATRNVINIEVKYEL